MESSILHVPHNCIVKVQTKFNFSRDLFINPYEHRSYHISYWFWHLKARSTVSSNTTRYGRYISVTNRPRYQLRKKREKKREKREKREEEGDPGDPTPLSLDDPNPSSPSFAEMLLPPRLRR
ncbi:hypothetical protein B296_00022068 [Ensete ventricosum]|uniref:Uncharacterized protein n=1 Tax=Ensete ventricosum TaxID=4639 RepID=A0A427AWT3_ENSVE|nr:hypothetical protein B296_00022068 [Ensete ventricosum]